MDLLLVLLCVEVSQNVLTDGVCISEEIIVWGKQRPGKLHTTWLEEVQLRWSWWRITQKTEQ